MLKLVFVVIVVSFITLSIESVPENSSWYGDKCPDAVKIFTQNVLRVSAEFLKSYTDSTSRETGGTSALAELFHMSAITVFSEESYTDSTSRETGGVSALAELFHMSALAVFAEGVTKNEIFSTLNLQTKEEIYCVADFIIEEAVSTPDCAQSLPSINIFANSDFPFTSQFLSKMSHILLRNIGIAKNIDFSNPNQAANEINELVATKTNNNIPGFIQDPSIFNGSTQLVLSTGLYFTSEWEIEMQSTDEVTQFRESPTKSEPQKFLYQDAVFLYGHSDILKAQVVQINFCCDTFNMWQILPDCPFTEDTLIDKMAENTDWYYKLLETMKPTRLDLYFPIYNQTTTVDLKTIYQKATNVGIFDEKNIELKGAIEGDRPANVSVGQQILNLMTSFKGRTVPNGTLKGPKKTVKFDYPHVWIIFRNGRVHFIGATRQAMLT